MASVKQLNMLCAKARKAGMDFDRSKSDNLDDEQIDALVKKFDANGGKQEKTVKAENVDAPKELNHVRFGLACKLVIQKAGYLWVIENPERFGELAASLYDVLNMAEKHISASLPGA